MDKKKLPAWNSLTKREQARLVKIHEPRLMSDYNVRGLKSISAKEKKGK